MNFFDFPAFMAKLQGFNALDPRQPMFTDTLGAGRPSIMRDPWAGAPLQLPMFAQQPGQPAPVVDLSTQAQPLAPQMSMAPRQVPYLEEAGLLATPPKEPPQMSVDPTMTTKFTKEPGGLLADPPKTPVDLDKTGAAFRKLGGMISEPGKQPAAMPPQILSAPQAGGGGRAVDITPYLRQSLLARRAAKR